MTRLRGRCPQEDRLICKTPYGHWQITTMIAAVRLDGPCAACVINSPTDSDIFRLYVRECLAPSLKPGDVVVMDNLSPHKSAGVREAIEAVGARLLYLPPYSPDFNPIENMWSKVKQHLRSLAAETFERLCEAVDSALSSVTPQDCQGFFRNCGYAAT